jgi:hypothetical protein
LTESGPRARKAATSATRWKAAPASTRWLVVAVTQFRHTATQGSTQRVLALSGGAAARHQRVFRGKAKVVLVGSAFVFGSERPPTWSSLSLRLFGWIPGRFLGYLWEFRVVSYGLLNIYVDSG